MVKLASVEELRKKDKRALQEVLVDLAKERFNLRMRHDENDVAKPHEFRLIRLGIARVKTILREKSN